MIVQECRDDGGLVAADVVADDVNLAALGLTDDDIAQEGDNWALVWRAARPGDSGSIRSLRPSA